MSLRESLSASDTDSRLGLYWTKKNSDVAMSSSACLKIVPRICMRYQGDGIEVSEGRGGTNGLKNGAVDLQHGTAGVEGSSHPCTKGRHPKEGFFLPLKTHTFISGVQYTVYCTILY
jgi:hypothetical protein